MPDPADIFVGRGRELASLSSAVDAAVGGRGSLWCVAGEPGIGKSRLAHELADRCRARGMDTLWGRSWESGGAPAYWPWIQVVRALVRERPQYAAEDAGAGLAEIAGLVPEIAPAVTGLAPAPVIGPEQAQFRLFDSVATLLGASAARAPIAVLLDDMHAADRTSLSLLEFVSRSLAGARLLIVVTYRDADARVAGVTDVLARAARAGGTIALLPLSETEVATYVEQASDGAADAPARAAVWSASEGNPLFMQELVRLQRGRATAPDRDRIALPDGITATIRERVVRLPQPTRELLGAASVAGREFGLTALAALTGCSIGELAPAIDEAAGSGLIAATGPGRYRFAHILIRETLHRDLPAARRSELHLRYARALRAASDGNTSLAELAHHFYEAGAEGFAESIVCADQAAALALRQLAFDEAAELLRRALAALEAVDPHDAHRRAELLIRLGHAQLLGGFAQAGKESCREAGAIARRLGDGRLLARAALEYGTVLMPGVVDPALVGLLREALAGIGADAPGLRAQVMARLAAAEQPAPDPARPIAMAREAIELARSSGDERALLDALRGGVSAMMDFSDPRERIPLNREHAALAERLGDQADVMRSLARLLFDHLESGDLVEADQILARYVRAAAALAHPYYGWHSAAMQAMRAIMRGDLDQADALNAQAAALAEVARDSNAALTLRLQRYGIARARHDDSALELVAEQLRLGVGADAAVVGRLFGASAAAYLEQEAETRRLSATLPLVEVAAFADGSVLTMLAEVAERLGDVELARLVHARFPEFVDRNSSWGMLGMVCEGPCRRAMALVAAVLGHRDEADHLFQQAIDGAERQGMPIIAARTRYEWARILIARGGADADRARGLIAGVIDLAGLYRLDGLARRARAFHTAKVASPARSTAPKLSLALDGDSWAIELDGTVARVKDSRGMQILARLVAEPGREFHALDLASPGGTAIDTGDAGEQLDAAARDAYRSRAEQLRAEIEQADQWNDAGRAARARGELDMLETELSRAIGLGGRDRRVSSAAERARVNVHKRIRDALRRIEAQHPALAQYLGWTIKTGAFCSYEPPR